MTCINLPVFGMTVRGSRQKSALAVLWLKRDLSVGMIRQG